MLCLTRAPSEVFSRSHPFKTSSWTNGRRHGKAGDIPWGTGRSRTYWIPRPTPKKNYRNTYGTFWQARQLGSAASLVGRQQTPDDPATPAWPTAATRWGRWAAAGRRRSAAAAAGRTAGSTRRSPPAARTRSRSPRRAAAASPPPAPGSGGGM